MQNIFTAVFNGLQSRRPYDAVANKVYFMEIKPV